VVTRIAAAEESGRQRLFDAGFKAANGMIIATIDADLRTIPEEIPRLLPILDSRMIQRLAARSA